MAKLKSKKRKRILIFTGIVVILISLVLVAVLRKREPVISVQTEEVKTRDITELVPANGRIFPVVQVKISPEVSGEIVELPVKEGQKVEKGDLLLRIKSDFYVANRNQSEASYKSSLADKLTSEANLRKAEAEFSRNEELYRRNLISDSAFMEVQTSLEIATASRQSSVHRVEMASASLARVEEELAKTTITSPLSGTVSRLISEIGERVVGTAQMSGTEVMTIADLSEMEARVDIGETDIVLIEIDQIARLEVDAFKDTKFSGVVTEIANSSQRAGGSGGQQQDATRFEVKIRINEKESFRPGMSVTAEIETRYQTNVLAVPIQSVTTRLPKKPEKPENIDSGAEEKTPDEKADTNNAALAGSEASSKQEDSKDSEEDKKSDEPARPIEVVFVVDGDRVKMVPVEMGISDDSHIEIKQGLKEGDEIVSGGFKAISRDLEDGKPIHKGGADAKKIKEDS